MAFSSAFTGTSGFVISSASVAGKAGSQGYGGLLACLPAAAGDLSNQKLDASMPDQICPSDISDSHREYNALGPHRSLKSRRQAQGARLH
jgi:hypothetical protein